MIDNLAKDAFGFLEPEEDDKFIQGSVCRSIVDHDDFEGGIFQREKGSDALDNRRFLVMGGAMIEMGLTEAIGRLL